MNVDRIIERIVSGQLSRSEFLNTRNNALKALARAKNDEMRNAAQKVIDACDNYAPEPLSAYYNFMGFCPGASFDNRQDKAWREKGICDFHFYDSEVQMEEFSKQLPGDWIIMKKIQDFGKTMKLYGFGRIKRRLLDSNKVPYFEVDWNDQDEEIEVPLLGCNATVNMRALGRVEKEMPPKFWEWLGHPWQ